MLPSDSYLYLTPAGVQNYYRELRDRNGRYFKAKAKAIAEVTREADRMEEENDFIYGTYIDCDIHRVMSKLNGSRKPRQAHDSTGQCNACM